MTVMLTILTLLASGFPSGACHCCAANVDSGSVQKSDQVVENCPRCATLHSRCDQAGNCCKSLKKSCDCHRHSVAMFIIEDSLGSDAETTSDLMLAQFSICDQLSGAKLGDAFYTSLALRRPPVSVFLCRRQL